jgi:hypothetical protein
MVYVMKSIQTMPCHSFSARMWASSLERESPLTVRLTCFPQVDSRLSAVQAALGSGSQGWDMSSQEGQAAFADAMVTVLEQVGQEHCGQSHVCTWNTTKYTSIATEGHILQLLVDCLLLGSQDTGQLPAR